MIGTYLDVKSPIHTIRPGIKLAGLAIAATAVFFCSNLAILTLALGAVGAAYAVARIPLKTAWKQLRPLCFLLLAIFIFQAIFVQWQAGAILVMRFLIVILLASLVTLTTRLSDIIETIEFALQPFRAIGVNPEKVSLAISLSIRFLPAIMQCFGEVREAQKVRGLERSVAATAVPLIIRTLRMADDIAEALDARCYDAKVKSPQNGRKLAELPHQGGPSPISPQLRNR